MPSHRLSLDVSARSRAARALLCIAGLVLLSVVTVRTVTWYRGLAAYYRFERIWLSHDAASLGKGWTREELDECLTHLNRAARIAPGYAYTHYFLAQVYLAIHGLGSSPPVPAQDMPPEGHPLAHALRHSLEAIKLEFTDGEYHGTLAWVYAAIAKVDPGLAGLPSAHAAYEQAEAEMRLACELDLGKADFRYRLGNFYALRGKWDQALATYRECVGLSRQSAPRILQHVLWRRGSLADVEAVFGRELETQDRLAGWLIDAKSTHLAVQLLMEAAQRTADDDVEGRLRVARRLLSASAKREAIGLLTEWLDLPERGDLSPAVLAEDSESVTKRLGLYLALVEALQGLHENKRALEVAASVGERVDWALHPLVPRVLAERHMAVGEKERALACLEEWRARRIKQKGELEQLSREEHKAVDTMAWLCMDLRRYERGAELFGVLTYQSYRSRNRRVYAGQRALCQLHLGKVQQGLRFFKGLVEQGPDDPDAHYSLGGAYEMLGDLIDARAEYRLAAKLDPRNGRYPLALKKVESRLEEKQRRAGPKGKGRTAR